MPVKLRLARAGSKKRPYYHIVAADVRAPRDVRFIEQLGSWNHMLPKDAHRVTLNEERIKHWLSHGATPTDRVLRFLDQAGIVNRPARSNPTKGLPGKKAQEREAERKQREEEAAAAAAEAAIARIESGDSSFEAEVTDRGLALPDVDMGDVTRGDLGDAADAVFAAEVDTVVGPFASDLGPAIYRVNGVLPAQETSFEEAQPILREQLVQDRARRVIDSLITDIDDLLAGGATLEELAQETEMVLGQIDWTPQSDSEIAGYDNFRDLAGTVSAEDFPEVAELGDGGIFALRLNAVNPPSPQPLDEVRDQVAADWTRTETETRLLAQAEALAGELAEGKTFAGLGLAPTTVTGQTRSGQLPNLPGNALEALFALDTPGTLTLPHQGRAIIFRLDEITPPDFESEENQVILSALEQQVGASLAADMFEALARDIQSRVGISIDQQALNAVHANFQ